MHLNDHRTGKGLALHILFVCTGNICRSPTAERLAIAYAGQFGIEGMTASSAGLRAVIGSSMHPKAAIVLEGLGGDASNFEARQLTPRVAEAAHLLLTMTAAHRNAVLELAPHLLRRVFTMAEAAWLATEGGAGSIQEFSDLRAYVPRGMTDIPDPIGAEIDVFQAVGSQIADLLPPIVGFCQRCEGLQA